MEYRRSIKSLNTEKKMENFSTLFGCVGFANINELLSKEELYDINYDTYFDN